jgi:hypothetical protein
MVIAALCPAARATGAGGAGTVGTGGAESIENWADDDNTVPTVFGGEHGGRQVYITGTFNGWSRCKPNASIG